MNQGPSLLLQAVVSALVLQEVASFVISPSSIKRSVRIFAADNDEEPDLFEYFDPLLSPHAYPNGISPDNGKASAETESSSPPLPPDESKFHLFGLLDTMNGYDNEVVLPEAAAPQAAAAAPDLFDPRISPHSYPDGTPDQIVGDAAAAAANSVPDVAEPVSASASEETLSPLNPNDFVSLLSSVSNNGPTKVPPVASTTEQPSFFDPRISPHAYPQGAPDQFIGDAPPTATEKPHIVGVLLMDHGSRNQASNDRLHELARLYQSTVASDNANMVVTAAHMEIAPPSIPDGLQTLLDAGVDEIICHPYFLSANGRHVSEDIPEIITAAKADLNISIPLTTTEPVGSQTDVMIRAMHTLVKGAGVLTK